MSPHTLFNWLSAVLLVWACLTPTNAAAQGLPTQTLTQAELHGMAASRSVTLPHILRPGDFLPAGSRVRYVLTVALPAAPDRPLGLFVSKLSLSGRLFVNGELIDTCDHASHYDLPALRCLHQPQLFVARADKWREGINTIELEIFATARQTNGLSPVLVGDAATLEEEHYLPHKWLRSALPQGLAWLSGLLGLLSLGAALMLQRERVYLWFGLTSLTNALATLNSFIVRAPVDIDLLNWFIFSVRLVSVPLLYLTLLAVFGKLQRWQVATGITYILLAPLATLLSNNHQGLVTALYAPLLLIALVLAIMSVRWSLQSRNWLHWGTCLCFLALYGSGIADWLRLAGTAPFEGNYLVAYTYTGMLVLLWALLGSALIAALKESRRLGALLEKQLRERTAYELTENIPVGTYTMVLGPGEKIARFSFLSRRFLEITGLSRASALENPIHAFACLHPDDLPGWLTLNAETFAHKTPFYGRARVIVDGKVRHIVAESVPRDLPDGSTVWEGVLIDETERVLESQAAERDRAALQANLLRESRMHEREQLLRDMHDGFGSQLASIRVMASTGRISPTDLPIYLDEIMADLHLVVDSLNQDDLTLEEALIDMRHRVETRLAGCAPQRHWSIELAGLPAQGSRTVLQIVRVIQEALHNAQRHAHAQNIWLSAHYLREQKQLVVRIRDDGVGIAAQPRQGRGLRNMAKRCREVGATLSIEGREPGTEVVLQMTGV